MRFEEMFYYALALLYTLMAIYLLLFKTEIFNNRWLTTGVVSISLLILRQTYERIKNGKTN